MNVMNKKAMVIVKMIMKPTVIVIIMKMIMVEAEAGVENVLMVLS